MANFDYLYNPNAAKGLIDKNYFVDKKLSFQVIEHGIILPYKSGDNTRSLSGGLGGIVDGNGKFIPNSFVYETDICKNYTPPQN